MEWIERLAEGAGVKVLEPLWGRDTLELAREVIEAGFEYAIIAVNKGKLYKEWLGYTFHSVEDLERFLDANPGIDPLGEFAEFHTVVVKCPLFGESFELKLLEIEESETYCWLRFRLVRE